MAKTFFWPTTLGVVSEQTPKGGALTLNAIAGIGMLSVGIIGGPFIGALQEQSACTTWRGRHLQGARHAGSDHDIDSHVGGQRSPE